MKQNKSQAIDKVIKLLYKYLREINDDNILNDEALQGTKEEKEIIINKLQMLIYAIEEIKFSIDLFWEYNVPLPDIFYKLYESLEVVKQSK